MRTLRTRLIAAGVVFTAIAVGVTAFLVARTTTTDLVGDVEDRLEVQSIVLSELTSYAVFQGSWNGVDALIGELAEEFGLRISLTDFEGRVLGDSDPDLDRPSAAAAVIDPSNPLFQTELVSSQVDAYQAYIDFVASCLADQGVPFLMEVDEFGLPVIFVEYRDEADFETEEGCYHSADEQLEVDPFEGVFLDEFVEPAVLFLGTAPTPAVDTNALLVAAGLVLAVLVVGVAAFSSRLTRPLTDLTAATAAVRGGDLTARVATDDETEIGTLATAFNEMAGELEKSSERRRRLTSDVAHELRTPLANATGHVEAMIDGVEQPTPEVLAVVREEIYRLGRLIDDLQQLSLADEQALTLDVIPLVIDDIIDQVVDANRGRAQSESISLGSFGSAPEPIDLDPSRIRQAIDNLVSNAIRHTPEGGSIAISVGQTSAATTVEVRDSGPGIPDEFLADVFERFTRADQSRTRDTGGSGLGLAITRQLVRAHDGDVSAANHPDGGAVFTVTLPGV